MTLRTITKDGEPWFVAADVCKALGYSTHKHGVRFYLANLNEGEISLSTPTQLGIARGPASILISESGLYKLTLGSRKPEARQFKDWVTSVVLPAIRKTGGYVMGEGYQRQDYFLLKP